MIASASIDLPMLPAVIVLALLSLLIATDSGAEA